MKCNRLQLAGVILLSLTLSAHAAELYVDVNGAAPTPPYTNWATAAATIQDAVDAAAAGDEIVVTNGVYQTGGRAVYGVMTNRVAVMNPVTLRSVNGPGVTVIQGYQVPGTINDLGAVRCVYLADGAALIGFTLTNGATTVPNNDPIAEGVGGGVWCAAASAVVSNCVLAGNSAASTGGGAYLGTLIDCTLTGNSAPGGGGAYLSVLNHCTLTGNSAVGEGSDYDGAGGGGAFAATLTNCTLTGNTAAQYGGAAYDGTLNNCTLTGNSAWNGGGAYDGTLNNCVLTGNFAPFGGGACAATLNNCTLTANSAGVGGGAFEATLNNCIVWNNLAPGAPNYSDCTLSYCCTTPLPDSGPGNLAADPQLASASHLSAGSPCRGAGSADYISGVDIDGEPWANPPSIGCDELQLGSATGGLGVSLQAAYTNVAAGFGLELTAGISGRVTASQWEFGDGTVVSNQPDSSHAWSGPGDYAIVLRAYNDSHPGGVSATAAVHVVSQPVHYVARSSTAPLAPYLSWATAATNIQDALDAERVAGALVLVSNGVYGAGGRVVFGAMSNRVAVTTPMVLRSVNGPAVTIIQGYQVPEMGNGDGAIRCATDLDGRPRIANGTVDVGAYEFQPGTSGSFIGWLQQYGLPTDGSAAFTDPDGDGLNNWQEWMAGTDPTNPASALRMLSVTGTVTEVTVTWSSVTNRSYSLERATNLGAAPAFALLASNLAGLAGTTTFTDTNALGAAPRFYRVRVEP